MTFMASVYNSRFTTLTPLCGSFNSNFRNKFLLLKQNIHKQDLVVLRLKTSPQKVYGRHHELVDPYKISISQMVMDNFSSSIVFFPLSTIRHFLLT